MRKSKPPLFEATSELEVSNRENRKQAIKNLKAYREARPKTQVVVIDSKTIVEFNPTKTTKDQVLKTFVKV